MAEICIQHNTTHHQIQLITCLTLHSSQQPWDISRIQHWLCLLLFTKNYIYTSISATQLGGVCAWEGVCGMWAGREWWSRAVFLFGIMGAHGSKPLALAPCWQLLCCQSLPGKPSKLSSHTNVLCTPASMNTSYIHTHKYTLPHYNNLALVVWAYYLRPCSWCLHSGWIVILLSRGCKHYLWGYPALHIYYR